MPDKIDMPIKTAQRVALEITVLAIIVFFAVPGHTAEGEVKFFVDASSSFDSWTRDPDPAQEQWMREHYFRMQTYSTYFDSRLSWYPNAWAYKDSYAIKPSWSVFDDHPDWVLRDANGALLYIPWGCSGGSCPQYAADFGNPDFRNWWIAGAKSLIAKGYRGIWVDDVNLSWRISNGNGDKVLPIDPRTGELMTLENYQRYFAEFMEQLRAALPDIEIGHNAIWYAGTADNPYIRRQIDASDYYNFERGISDGGIKGGTGKYGFETFLSLIDYIHSRGRNVILDDDDSSSDRARDYELAFYFLVNNGGDMISADGDRDRMNPDNFWHGYTVNLGRALDTYYRTDGVFRRDFECGTVLVNQPEMSTRNVNLGGQFKTLDGVAVESVSISASSGVILTKACDTDQASAPMPPSDLVAIGQ